MGLKFSKRRAAVIIFSIVMIVGITIAAFANPEDSDTLLVALLGMFVLGVFQLLSAIAGALRGSTAQSIYLLASFVYLGHYIGCVVGYYEVPNFGIEGTFLGILGSLALAVIYVLILLFDRSKPKEAMMKPEDELLDDF